MIPLETQLSTSPTRRIERHAADPGETPRELPIDQSGRLQQFVERPRHGSVAATQQQIDLGYPEDYDSYMNGFVFCFDQSSSLQRRTDVREDTKILPFLGLYPDVKKTRTQGKTPSRGSFRATQRAIAFKSGARLTPHTLPVHFLKLS